MIFDGWLRIKRKMCLYQNKGMNEEPSVKSAEHPTYQNGYIGVWLSKIKQKHIH